MHIDLRRPLFLADRENSVRVRTMRVVRVASGASTSYGVLRENVVQLWTAAPWANGRRSGDTLSLDEVRLLAPCQPKKIIAVAINFPGATGLKEDLSEPLVFLKPGTSVIGPGDTIASPFSDTPVWGESELAVVIGKTLSRGTPAQAVAAVFGYTIGNDVSADNVQGWDHHLARSKGADTFCVLGPWIDTEFKPDGKTIRGYHNDVLLREGAAAARLFAEPELLVWLSSWMTLEPGDVILTGAPTRVRERQYLRSGDAYSCVIDGLGELRNPFQCVVKS